MKLLLVLTTMLFSVNSFAGATVESILPDLPSETVFTYVDDTKMDAKSVALIVYNKEGSDVQFCGFIDRDNPVKEGENRILYAGTKLITKGKPYLDFITPAGHMDNMFIYFHLYGYKKSMIYCIVRKKMDLKIWALDERMKATGSAKLSLPTLEEQEANQNQCSSND